MATSRVGRCRGRTTQTPPSLRPHQYSTIADWSLGLRRRLGCHLQGLPDHGPERHKTMTLEPGEFIGLPHARAAQGFHRIRRYGPLARRHKGARCRDRCTPSAYPRIPGTSPAATRWDAAVLTRVSIPGGSHREPAQRLVGYCAPNQHGQGFRPEWHPRHRLRARRHQLRSRAGGRAAYRRPQIPEAEQPDFSVPPLALTAWIGNELWQRIRGTWERYGYACVGFGHPLSLRDYLGQRGVELRALSEEQRFAEIAQLGQYLARGVGHVIQLQIRQTRFPCRQQSGRYQG